MGILKCHWQAWSEPGVFTMPSDISSFTQRLELQLSVSDKIMQSEEIIKQPYILQLPQVDLQFYSCVLSGRREAGLSSRIIVMVTTRDTHCASDQGVQNP